MQLSNQNATNFPNEALPVAFRVANMIADIPSADLYVGPVAGTPTFSAVAYGSVAALKQLPAGTLTCTATVAGAPATVLFTGTVTLAPGKSTTDTNAVVVNQPLLSIAGAIAAAGSYDLVFTATATTGPIAGPDPITIDNGGIYTIYVIDAPGGGAPYHIVVSTF